MAKRQAHKMISNFNALINFVNTFAEIILWKNKQVLRCSEYGYAHVTQQKINLSLWVVGIVCRP